jgi:hypothetical protein
MLKERSFSREGFASPAGSAKRRIASGSALSAGFQMVPMPVGIEPQSGGKEMKKLLVVLLSLGLIAAFSMTASAADVKFGGSYYVAGAYDNNPGLIDNGNTQAYAYQQVRIKPIFQIAEGLTFTLRFDALEKQWGDMRWVNAGVAGNPTSTSDKNGTRISQGAANVATAENVDFEQAYVTFNTALGEIKVGYQDSNAWGTNFGNSPGTLPGIVWQRKLGNFIMAAQWEHLIDNTTTNPAVYNLGVGGNQGPVDADSDTYALMGVYKAGGVEAGLLYKWYYDNSKREATLTNTTTGVTTNMGYRSSTQLLSPYAKLNFGPLYVEAEVSYMFGKSKIKESDYAGAAADPDVTVQSYSAYINANYKFGPATVGGLFAIVSGDDKTADTQKGALNCGYAWNPALILMNGDLKWWGGSGHVPNFVNKRAYINSLANAGDDVKRNTIWYNLYANYAVTPKLALGTALTYATVQTKKLTATTEADSDKLGTEFDLTASYKLFDNLTYMVGAGYLWTGDYFKQATGGKPVANDYVLTNKLTLNF